MARNLTLIVIEPIPPIFAVLERNLTGRADAMGHAITLLEVGVSDAAGEVDFVYIEGTPGESCMRGFLTERSEQQRVLHRAVTASSIRGLREAVYVQQQTTSLTPRLTPFRCNVYSLAQIFRHLKMERIDLLKVFHQFE
jgi:hypothetical protein